MSNGLVCFTFAAFTATFAASAGMAVTATTTTTASATARSPMAAAEECDTATSENCEQSEHDGHNFQLMTGDGQFSFVNSIEWIDCTVCISQISKQHLQLHLRVVRVHTAWTTLGPLAALAL